MPSGSVVFVNPPEKHGKVVETDQTKEYQFQIPQDLVDPNYSPQVGDAVTFNLPDGNEGSVADEVAKSDDPPKSR